MLTPGQIAKAMARECDRQSRKIVRRRKLSSRQRQMLRAELMLKMSQVNV